MFQVLFCSQLYRHRKNKPWRDGFLKVKENRASLFDENEILIESTFLKNRVLDEGAKIDFESHIVQIETTPMSHSNLNFNTTTRVSTSLPKFIPPKITEVKYQKNVDLNRTYGNSDLEYLKGNPQQCQSDETNQLNTIRATFNLPIVENVVKPVIKPLSEKMQWGLFVDKESHSEDEENLPLEDNSDSSIYEMKNSTKRKKIASSLTRQEKDLEQNEITEYEPFISENLLSNSKLSNKYLNSGKFVSPPAVMNKSKFLNADPNSKITYLGAKNSKNRIQNYSKKSYNKNSSKQGYSSIQENDYSKKFLPFSDTVLKFPNKFESYNLLKSRTIVIPAGFETLTVYKKTFWLSLMEHLQIQISILSQKYHQLKINDERAIRSHGIPIYLNAQIKRIFGIENTKVQNVPSVNNSEVLILSISNKEASNKYSKDDIWAISPKKCFSISFMAKSIQFGPSSNNSLELIPLSSEDANTAFQIIGHEFNIYKDVVAVRIINASIEFQQLSCLNSFQIFSGNNEFNENDFTFHEKLKQESSILNYISNPEKFLAQCTSNVNFQPFLKENNKDVDITIGEFLKEYSLNCEQRCVIDEVLSSLKSFNKPITLVQGVFGAGKSFVISVLIALLYHLQENDMLVGKNGGEFRVVISSMTNVAVDRILSGLINIGFNNFIRIGSLKKILKTVLPYYSAITRNDENELKELQEMLTDESLTELEREGIQTAIQKSSRIKDVSSYFLIGVTCAATNFSVFDNTSCDILILDECSQMTEPMSILPLCKFSCERAVLVGDPKQLSPTLTTTLSKQMNEKNLKGLEWTLFERLENTGKVFPIKLTTQYRCHPYISTISNSLFYNNSLKDGANLMKTNSPIIFQLPPICLIDVKDGYEERSPSGGSFFNKKEGEACAKIVQELLQKEISSSDIGVICLYKGQVDFIESLLKCGSKTQPVQVSTVDAFQGAEKSIIILTICKTKGNGFIDNERRVNVAITRAKRHLFVIGNETYLYENRLWSRIIQEHFRSQSFTLKSNLILFFYEERNHGMLHIAQLKNIIINNEVDFESHILSVVREGNSQGGNKSTNVKPVYLKKFEINEEQDTEKQLKEGHPSEDLKIVPFHSVKFNFCKNEDMAKSFGLEEDAVDKTANILPNTINQQLIVNESKSKDEIFVEDNDSCDGLLDLEFDQEFLI